MDLILTIDVGTQSIRAIIIDLKGKIVLYKKTLIEPYVSPKPGWAEQDPQYYWQKLCETCQALFKKAKNLKKSIRGISLTSQRCTLINLDKKGKPLRPAIVWPDQRRTKHYKPVSIPYRIAFKLVGMMDTLRFAQEESEINWLSENQPQIMEKTHKFVFLSCYLIYRLTNNFIDSYASQVGYVPFDYKHFTWCKKRDWHWQAFPINRDKLPDLVAPTEVLGKITQKASQESGIPQGLPLIASGSDKTCEFLGAGCLNPQSAGLSYGTTATIGTYNKKYLEIIPFIPPYPSAIPGVYNNEFQIYRGFWLVSWFKKEFGIQEVKIASQKGIEPESLFDNLLEQVPPGALGLMLQPTWSPGVKIPGPEAKGAIIGFGDIHTRAHLYRAIIEGLCYGLRDGGERIQKRSSVRFKELRISGGGAQSTLICQITADIFNLPVLKPHVHDTSCLGAAIDAAVGLGLYSDFESAVANMTHTERVYEPIPHHVNIYEEIYTKVYKHIYNKLKPLYQKIREITGYPQ